MDTAEIVVVIGAVLLIAFILWFFFGPREPGRQESEVVEKNRDAATPADRL